MDIVSVKSLYRRLQFLLEFPTPFQRVSRMSCDIWMPESYRFLSTTNFFLCGASHFISGLH